MWCAIQDISVNAAQDNTRYAQGHALINITTKQSKGRVPNINIVGVCM